MPLAGEWWGLFCRAGLHDTLFEITRVPGSPLDGVFFLPPPVLELSFAEGLWAKINERTGLMFDLAEEEDIRPEISKEVVEIIREAANRYRGSDATISHWVGQRSSGEDVLPQMSAEEYSDWLTKLSLFLEKEASRNNTVEALS